MGTILRLIGAGLVLLGALAATQLRMAPGWVLGVYLIAGVVSFGLYGFDKRAARRGDRRIRETTLHGIDAIGGVAGGLIGQVVFRHKTYKEGFVAVTVLIAAAHVVALGLLVPGFWRVPAILFFS